MFSYGVGVFVSLYYPELPVCVVSTVVSMLSGLETRSLGLNTLGTT